jgi:hypothetical protein
MVVTTKEKVEHESVDFQKRFLNYYCL